MGLTLDELVKDGFAILDLGKRVAAAEAAVPAGTGEFETVAAKAKVAASFLPEAIDLAVQIKRDAKS